MAKLTQKRRRWWLLAVPIAVLALFVALLFQQTGSSGIRITIQNTGSADLRLVVLYVTGREYPLGDIAPGASAHATVNPTSESHLEIGFTDAGGQPKRLNAGGYFESGYRGTIRISIKDGTITENDQQYVCY